jgi:hypothetical protein
MRPHNRRWIVAASLACFVAAYALTPSEVRSRASTRFSPAARPSPVVAAARLAPLPASGDPFVPQLADDASASAPLPARPPVDVDALSRIGPLPANLGATSSPLLFAVRRDAYVSAIALGGPHPSALIVDGGISHVVGVGTLVDGATVSGIDVDGVRLTDGRTLALPASRDPR